MKRDEKKVEIKVEGGAKVKGDRDAKVKGDKEPQRTKTE